MSKITVCLDCPSYQKGGYCPHKRKEVSALDPACDHAKIMNAKFNPEDEDAPMQTVTESHQLPTTKKCERCGEVLPLDDFEWMNYKGARKRMRICSKCYHAAMSKKKGQPEVPEGMKRCSRCKEVKPLTEFHKDCCAPDGHKSACKICHSRIVNEKQKARREARRQEAITSGDLVLQGSKICKRCGRELPKSHFNRHARCADGLQPNCMDCQSELLKAAQAKRLSSRYGIGTKKDETPAPQPTTIVVRETLTDEQMVNILREHGWEVTCRRTVTQEI
jgi:hypothetical protein